MQKAEAKIEETTVEVDFSAMEKRIVDNLDLKIREGFEKYPKDKEQGKGVVEPLFDPDKKARLLEEFHKGENCDPQVIKEQWTIAIPRYATKELAGHLRDFVWVTEAIKGKAGDIVNIPYVRDFEFTHASPAGTGAFSGVSSLVSTLTTTLHESGEYYDAYYSDIEKIDSNLLDELNRVFAHAAIRAEDQDLMALFDALTDCQFHSVSGLTMLVGAAESGTSNRTSAFSVNWVADALGKQLKKGKEIRPGDCILYMNPTAYRDLMKSILATTTTAFGYAKVDAVQTGMIEQLLGIRIVVGGYKAGRPRGGSGAPTGTLASTFQCAYLFRPKRALALAPKRDILIETDKLIKTRQLTITGSHTYGVALIDPTEACRIWTGNDWRD